jgi:protease II
VTNLISGTKEVVAYDDYKGELAVATNKSYRIQLLPHTQQYYSDIFKYQLDTLHRPARLMSYNMATKISESEEYLEQFTPSLIPEDYISERIQLPANDGAIIPATIVYNRKYVRPSDNVAIVHT